MILTSQYIQINIMFKGMKMDTNDNDRLCEDILNKFYEFHGVPKHHRRQPLQIILREAEFLSTTIKNNLTKAKNQQIRFVSKIQEISNDNSETLSSGESYLKQLESSLKQTQQECKKKIQKFQIQRLNSQLELNNLFDQDFMRMAQQNNMQDFDEEQSTYLIKKVQNLKVLFQKQRKIYAQLSKRLKMEFQEIKTQGNKKITQLRSQYTKKAQEIEQKMILLNEKMRLKIDELKSRRILSQKSLLSEIQRLILKHSNS